MFFFSREHVAIIVVMQFPPRLKHKDYNRYKNKKNLAGHDMRRGRSNVSFCFLTLASATDGTKFLVNSVCETAPKSLFWVPTCVMGFQYVP